MIAFADLPPRRPDRMPPIPVMLTVDVESDWGTPALRGIREALPRFLDLLDRARADATFFVVGALAAEFRRQLPPGSRHEVGSHGDTHRQLTRLAASELRDEVVGSKAALEAAGYVVDGFRAPFLYVPRALPGLLAEAGYRYDCSRGSILPSLRNRSRGLLRAPVLRPPPARLRDGVSPCSLTMLRVHPFGAAMLPARAHHVSLHLHELLEPPRGWAALRAPVHWLHARNSGPHAWRLLERLLRDGRRRFVTCRQWLAAAA